MDPSLEKQISKISILSNATPEDKKLLVVMLRKIGETVAVTGDCNFDIPAMKSADVAFTNHKSNTLSTYWSQMRLSDDYIRSLHLPFFLSRVTYVNIQKFLQFQMTTNIVSLIIVFTT